MNQDVENQLGGADPLATPPCECVLCHRPPPRPILRDHVKQPSAKLQTIYFAILFGAVYASILLLKTAMMER